MERIGLAPVDHNPRVHHAFGRFGLGPHLRRRGERVGVQAAADPVIEDVAEHGTLAGDGVGGGTMAVQPAGECVEHVQHLIGVGQVRERLGVGRYPVQGGGDVSGRIGSVAVGPAVERFAQQILAGCPMPGTSRASVTVVMVSAIERTELPDSPSRLRAR